MASPRSRAAPNAEMGVLRLILLILIVAIVVLFASFNTQLVTLHLWPSRLDHPLPLAVLVLCPLIVGYLVGLISRWWPNIALRRRLRRAEAELAHVQAQLRTTSRSLAGNPPSPGPPIP